MTKKKTWLEIILNKFIDPEVDEVLLNGVQALLIVKKDKVHYEDPIFIALVN